MKPGRCVRCIFTALLCVLGLPAIARAQSAIGGTVKDTSGAVLPGVTVEVASDVLIEKRVRCRGFSLRTNGARWSSKER